MTKNSKFYSLIIWIILSIAISACSNNGGNETTLNLETESDNITSLGEFPVGIRDYEPPVIEITSPVSANPVTTITDNENGYLREVIKGEKWALDVKGKVTPSTFGTEKSPLEFKGVYVNWKLVDAANGDDIKWVDGKFTFTKTVFVTKEDLANTSFTIVVAAVDEKGFVAGVRSVVIIQDRASNKIGVPLGNALHLVGNKEFVSNALSMLVSQIEGLNFASSMGTVTLLGVDVLVPRTVMLQGVEISDYSISSNGADLCSVKLNIKVSNLVVEYTNRFSIFTKGQNIVNINMKNVEIHGLIIELRNEKDIISAYLKAGDIALVKGADFKYNLDTPFIEIFNYLLDNVFSFLIQDVFNKETMKPVQLKIGYNALNLLIKQLSGNDLTSTPVIGLKYCSEDNGGIKLGMDMTLPEVKRKGLEGLKSTYASVQGKSDKIDLAVNYGNSSIALSDDYLNQLLATNFLTDPNNPQEITSLDLNELIEKMDINLGDFKLWTWLRDSNNKLPKIKIKFLMPTPPILKIQGNGNYVGTLSMKNILVEVYELDVNDNEAGLLARLSIDLDIAMKWENEKFVLECGKGDASYILLFNKLYPLFLPPQLKEIHTYIANSLNQLLSKIELIGYPVKNVSALNDAYLVFSGNLEDEIKPDGSDNNFISSVWEYRAISSNPRAETADKLRLNGSNDGLISFNTLDKNNYDQEKEKFKGIKDLDWNDSCGYFFNAAQSNKLITGISFDRNVVLDWLTGETVEFYEEFAVMCIMYGNAVKSDVVEDGIIPKEFLGYIPGEGCSIPFDLTLEDMPGMIMPVSQSFKLPLSSNVGIGIRVKKDPSIPLKLNPVALKLATATNIVVEYIDLNLNLGLNF
jgi:hypothetical protein